MKKKIRKIRILDLCCTQTTALYQAVFREVREVVPPRFQPTQVIADFEEALAAAVRAVFSITTSQFQDVGSTLRKRSSVCANWVWWMHSGKTLYCLQTLFRCQKFVFNSSLGWPSMGLTPAFSTHAILPASHFPLLHFQSPRTVD